MIMTGIDIDYKKNAASLLGPTFRYMRRIFPLIQMMYGCKVPSAWGAP